MIITPPRFLAKRIATCSVHLVTIGALLLQLLLWPTAPAVQAQSDTPEVTPAAEPGAEADLPTTTAEVVAAFNPTVPVYITVQVDRPLLVVGETAAATVTVASNATAATPALEVMLDLPNGLATSAGQKNKLRWNAPPLAVGESWQQGVLLVVDKPKQALKQGVMALRATAHAAGHAPYRGERLLGIAPTAPGTESIVDSEGAVVRNPQGDVTLLVTPGAAALGVRFAYTELHHWRGTAGQGAQRAPQETGRQGESGSTAVLTPTADLTVTSAVTTQPAVTTTTAVTATPVLTPTATPSTGSGTDPSTGSGTDPSTSAATGLANPTATVDLYLPAVSSPSTSSGTGPSTSSGTDPPTDAVVVAAQELTEMQTVTLTGQATTTVVSEVTTAVPLTATVPLTESTPVSVPQPVVSANVAAYAIWQLEAWDGATPVTEFSGPSTSAGTGEVQVVVSAAALVAQGVDPAKLGLWTRPTGTERWSEVESSYDPATQSFSAWLPHFSEFNLGQGLSQHGAMLPSMRAFSVDRLSGAATFAFPIETPAGLGGLSPNLSLSYSSVTIDELFRKNGQDAYKAQASGVGLGWNLGGISYIARAGGSMDNGTYYQDREYVLALNGQHVRLKYENNAWQSDPALFAKVERPVGGGATGKDYEQWFVTTSDGVKYTFGDPNVNPTTFVNTTATSTFTQQQSGGAYERTAKRWYLVSVEDRLGNRMSYSYTAEKGDEIGCVPSNRDDLKWYTRAIYPSQILWSQNGGFGPHLRVAFSYSGSQRADYQVEKWGSNDCTQTEFAWYNRLDQIWVQAAITGGWQTIRSYLLGYTYSAGVTVANKCDANNNYCKRLLLTSIQPLGKSGGGLPAHSFSYTGNQPAAIYLQTANNGFGGAITYTYLGHQPTCDAGTCGSFGVRWRQAVVRTDVADGLGNTAITTYCYGPTELDANFNRINGNSYCDATTIQYVCSNAQSGQQEWGAMSIAAEFLGYCRADATSYALTTTPSTLPSVIRWESTEGRLGPRGNPDPRRGRVWKQEVRSSRTSGTVLSKVENFWNSYRSAHAGCASTAGWCDTADNTSIHDEGQQKVFHINWVRLDAVSSWSDNAGALTRNYYQSGSQGGYQYGNLTEVQELSHSESSLALSTWESRVSGNTGLTLLRKTLTAYVPNPTTQVVNKPARVLITAIENSVEVCKAETRFVYDVPSSGNYAVAPTNGLLVRTQRPISGCVSGSTTSIADVDNGWQTVYTVYNAYGSPTQTTSFGNSSSQNDTLVTVYDSTYQLFPIQQYKNQNSTFQENAVYYGVNETVSGLTGGSGVWGQMKEHCAVNEICTQQSYDEFGRPLRRWERIPLPNPLPPTRALPSDSSASVLWSYAKPNDYTFGSKTSKTYIVTEWRAPRCYGNFTRTHYNGLGQVVIEQRPYQNWSHAVDGCGTNDQGQEIDVNYIYDALGNQVKASVPRLWERLPNDPNHFAIRPADLSVATTTSYDALSRPATVTAPNGEVTTYTYAGRTTGVYTRDRAKATNVADAYKVVKWQTVNGLGYLQNVYTRRWTGSGWSTVAQENLTHDVTGNLTHASHADNAGVTQLWYDLLGRKTQMTDADLGTWTYAHDRQGHLTRQTDARSKAICLHYDNLGRLVGKEFRIDNGSTTLCANPSYNVSYTYDGGHSSNNRSRGQLTQVRYTDSSYQKDLAYNSQGLLIQSTVTIPIAGAGDINTTQYGYDAYQRPNTLTYPGGEVVTTSYNSMGLPSQLSSNQLGTVVDNASYDAHGRLVQLRQTLSGLWRNYLYDPFGQQNSNGGQLTHLWIGSSNNTGSAAAYDRQKFDYVYDSFGNIVTMDEGATSTFTYDSHNRLTNATSYDHNYNYTYDGAGRLTQYENVTYTAYDANHKHAVVGVANVTRYSYDNNGNMVTRWVPSFNGSQTLTWNHENRLSSVVGAGTDTTYGYDPDGQRIKAVTALSSTYYPFANFEVKVSGGVATNTKFYDFGGLRVAMRENTNPLMYLYQNHLGSVIYATHDGGGAISDQRYFPYGRKRSGGTLPTDHRFTGQKYSDDNGLYYYNARYYDPQLGTFISPDTLVPDPGNLFDYNRYMYARGNPLKYNDPSGHNPACMSIPPSPWTSPAIIGCEAAMWVGQYGQTAIQLASQWLDKLPAMGDWLFNKPNTADQAAHSAGQNAGNSSTGDPNDPNKQGPIQEQLLRDSLSKTYNQRFGTTDAAIRQGLGITGKTADFVGHNAQTNKWLIAESKGGDLGKAFDQLTNTAQGLLSKVPDAAGNLELRVYMNATQYGKLTEGLLPGWRTNNGYLGWLDESDQFVYAMINGVKVLVQQAQ